MKSFRGKGRVLRGRGNRLKNKEKEVEETLPNNVQTKIIEYDDDDDEQADFFDAFDGIRPNKPQIKVQKPNPSNKSTVLFVRKQSQTNNMPTPQLTNTNNDTDPFKYRPNNNNNNEKSNNYDIYTSNNNNNISIFKSNQSSNNNISRNSSNYNQINSLSQSIQRPISNTKQDKFKNRTIEKNSDVFRELKCKLNPKLFNVDKKIYNELDKFNKMVSFIVDRLPKSQQENAFFLLCKVFTLDDLKNINDKNEKSSIFGIFFEGGKFKLEGIFRDICIRILMYKHTIDESEINDMFSFFRVLIDASISNAEILQPMIDLFERVTTGNSQLNEQVEMIKSFIIDKEENVQNSLESAVSPTAEDLFISRISVIDNSHGKIWGTLGEYKQGMIALTKENFYTPFRKSLNDMKEGKLDARDLFLYKNVQIAFTSNIKNYSAFKDCNFFLTFQIRTPDNWKHELATPDWKYTDQLGNRSLLILSTSPDLLKIDAVCRSCAVARSPDQDESRLSILFLNKGILPVVLISGQIKQSTKYYMFEPTSCWPAVQPVLQRLLKINERSFPNCLINKIIRLDFSQNVMPETHVFATHVLLKNHVGASPRFQKMATEKWEFDTLSDERKDQMLRVDHEQYKALRYSLLHTLTLVNGAPGTGKTHFAREYIRIMSQTEQKPIAVITFTNHALDAILEGVIGFFKNEQILRWGGPMRSTNPILKERKWRNYYLPRDIRYQKNEIVTLKQHLKNMYNIRQMAYMCIKEIPKNPLNLKIYKKIMEVLNNFFDASKRMANQYRLNFTPSEFNDYIRYLRMRDGRINYTSLPDEDNALICWLNGEQFYEKRNSYYHDILNYNRRIVDGEKYFNPFNYLNGNDDDENDDSSIDKNNDDIKNVQPEIQEEKEPSPEDINLNSSEKVAINTNDDDFENDKEEEEEEEEEANDKKYNDDDIIELTRVTLDGSEISANLPVKYLNDFLIDKFNILFEVKNPENKKTPDKLMIEYLKAISDPLTQMIEKFEDYLQNNEVSFGDCETKEAGKYLKKMKLIGMTSTVASIRKEALEVAGCEIMLVEEAGELTESMLSCILPNTLKRLILIGDYQQLRPKVEHELTKEPFNYDISLFEKLVVSAKEQKADCLFTLSVQRRMHPQISSLIRRAFYSSGEEQITDAPETGLLGIPFGIPYRVRFIMHNYEENQVATRSHVNIQEAKYSASLVPFFICRGYKPEDITIIALYKGQKYQIEREIETLYNKVQKKNSSRLLDPFGKIRNPRRIKVVVLDNFQGEENKVIIVSLTRSNTPGFVKNRNRALVTLSRAREMLVVLGHERIFGQQCKGNDQWKEISKAASKLNAFSMSNKKEKGLAVNQCMIHNPNSEHAPSFLETPEQVFKYRFSYCREKCNFKLPCGHNCQLPCHCHNEKPEPREHADYCCRFRCEKKCPNGHQCTGICGVCTQSGKCPDCRVKVHHVFKKCNHETDIECYLVTSGRAVCYAECGKTLNRCGHTCRLQCGHRGQCQCNVTLSKMCKDCGRTFTYLCGETNPKCHNMCNFALPCGHTCMSKCYICSERGHHDEECQHECDFVFPCGHKCQRKCYEKFPLHHHYFCTQKMPINHNYCGNHGLPYQMLLSECSKPLKCNYSCQHFCSICGKRCSHLCSEKCIERCNCRCSVKCNICGKECRCLAGERCAIFCPHFNAFKNVEEPPESDGLLYVFHDNHFLPLEEAKERMKRQYEAMIMGKSDKPEPIHRLFCPCDNCGSNEPCVVGSWLFDNYNKKIEKMIGKIRSNSEKLIAQNTISKNENSYNKINWFVCKDCGEPFPVKFTNPDKMKVECPKCGQKKTD